MNKKYFILGGLALAALSSYGAKKGLNISTVASGLETKLIGVRKPNIYTDHLKAMVDIKITNPSTQALDFSTGGAATLKHIEVFDKKGNLFATATPNIQAISIVPGGSVVLENVEIKGYYSDIISVIVAGISTNPNDYTIKSTIEALGSTFTI